jgi:1-acyl-sn-glycerol-3-phosphate acyltransferase
VFIGGSYDAWPPGRRLPRLRPLLVRFGRPLTFEKADEAERAGEKQGGAAAAERHRKIADQLHDAVAALAEEGPSKRA